MNPPRPPKPASGLPVKIPGGAKPVSPPSAPGGSNNSPAAVQQDAPDDTGSSTGITVPRLTQFSSLRDGRLRRTPSRPWHQQPTNQAELVTQEQTATQLGSGAAAGCESKP
jgi:hypothetical protein